MTDYVTQMLSRQFEAALCMLNHCIQACPPQHWEGRIANDTFRQIAYHTLFYVDFYLSPSDAAFQLRDLHQRGGDERGPTLSPGLGQDETLAYAAICRQKLAESLSAETAESLAGPCGIANRPLSRGELYIYNIRHMQHHAGQMSAYLRRLDGPRPDPKTFPWIGTGWR